ncbi:MAG TPA: hypothetical protein VGW58_18705 [Pyrinomonadaceae bacterium]|nr:hypothetical protein [Pyrinomonadaceae bacterium]
MTNGTDRRSRAAEKLGAMATDACVVIRVISDVGVLGDFGPVFCCWFVAGVAFGLVFGG